MAGVSKMTASTASSTALFAVLLFFLPGPALSGMPTHSTGLPAGHVPSSGAVTQRTSPAGRREHEHHHPAAHEQSRDAKVRGTETEMNGRSKGQFDTWAWNWIPGETIPDRKVVTVRVNYLDAEQSTKWLSCAKENNLLTSDGVSPLRPGVKLLFMGNSHVRQLAENLLMSIPDHSITSSHHSYLSQEKIHSELARQGISLRNMYRCPCKMLPPTSKGGVPTRTCDMVDVQALADERRRAGIKEPVVCDSHMLNSPLTNDTFFCGDGVAITRLVDGTTITQMINDPLMAVDLEEALSSVLNETLSSYDAVIANGLQGLNKCGDNFNPQEDGVYTSTPQKLPEQLAKGGFTGSLFFTSQSPRARVSKIVKEEWETAARSHGVKALLLPVFDPLNTPEEACGRTHCNGHTCIPGEAILWSQYLLRFLHEHTLRDKLPQS